MAKFSLYRDRINQFRWRLIANNGRIIAESGESYHNKTDAGAGIEFVRVNAKDAGYEEI